MNMKLTLPAVFSAALFAVGAHASPPPPPQTLALVPSGGTIFGNSGGVVGWGYDFTNNDSADWVALNDSFVTGSLASGTFGNYMDYIALTFIVVNPSSSTGTVLFSQGVSGTGEFDIAPAVPSGTKITGDIGIDYTVFSQDPNSPSFDPNSFVAEGTVFANAEVVTPEPGLKWLTAAGLLPLALAVWRRRQG
jgi:hypothetical protein